MHAIHILDPAVNNSQSPRAMFCETNTNLQELATDTSPGTTATTRLRALFLFLKDASGAFDPEEQVTILPPSISVLYE